MVSINLTWGRLLTLIGTFLLSAVSALGWVRSESKAGINDLKADMHRLENRLDAGLKENRELIIKYIAKEK